MNENAKKWVKALRSGSYTQATGRLMREGSYCCLGVACDLYRKETGDPSIDGYLEMGVSLPPIVTDWLGLENGGGTYGEESTYVPSFAAQYSGKALSCDNDNGATFKEIADIIESEPEGLFAS